MDNLLVKTLTFLSLSPIALSGSLALDVDDPVALDYLIGREIYGDAFYDEIYHIASTEPLKNILEIGSSSGEGSTEAFVLGIRKNPVKANLFCMELSVPRFQKLKNHYKNDPFVKCYNASSVSLDMFPSEAEIITFYNSVKTNLSAYPLNTILSWLRVDIDYVKKHNTYGCGINYIKKENDIDFFDMVLIDGSEFTGKPELDLIYGAKYILLDDINAYKNYENHHRLKVDPNYEMLTEDYDVRGGYSVFRLRLK